MMRLIQLLMRQMIEKYEKQSEFKRNYNTLIEGIKIGIKNAVEYKINIILNIIVQISFILVLSISVSISSRFIFRTAKLVL